MRQELAAKVPRRVSSPQDHRACTIGKQGCGVLVFPVYVARHSVPTCDQDVPVVAIGGDVARGQIQRGHPACTRGIYIEGASVHRAQLVLYYRRCRR